MSILPIDDTVLTHRLNDPKWITLEATVPTGLEKIAAAEIFEKLNIRLKDVDIMPAQGHVYFNIPITEYSQVLDLRSVDNINIVSQYIKQVNFMNSKEEDLKKLKNLASLYDLIPSVKKWMQLTEFMGVVEPTRDEHNDAKVKRVKFLTNKANSSNFVPEDPQYEYNVMKYRVTCTRSLRPHSFTSQDAALIYGGELNDKYNWLVGLHDWDLNVLLKVISDNVVICLKLTKESMHRRCLVQFGPTSLRPTIAYGMLRLCNIQAGELVIDPLCGGGSIPIEVAHDFRNCLVMCGDIHSLAVERTRVNVAAMPAGLFRPDVFKWDSIKLPFKTAEVDVICTDFPFGKRTGNPQELGRKYADIMKEFARVLKKGTGRACILVHHANLMMAVIGHKDSFLKVQATITVNVGGLRCSLLHIRRAKE